MAQKVTQNTYKHSEYLQVTKSMHDSDKTNHLIKKRMQKIVSLADQSKCNKSVKLYKKAHDSTE